VCVNIDSGVCGIHIRSSDHKGEEEFVYRRDVISPTKDRVGYGEKVEKLHHQCKFLTKGLHWIYSPVTI